MEEQVTIEVEEEETPLKGRTKLSLEELLTREKRRVKNRRKARRRELRSKGFKVGFK